MNGMQNTFRINSTNFKNKNRCSNYIGFFLPNHMKISVIKSRLKYFLPVFLIILLGSCEEKKFQSPDTYKVDLFADERQEGKAYVMSKEEAYEGSAMVLSTSDMKLTDSSTGRGKPIFIYKVNAGEILKTTRDSVISYPFEFLSPYKLKLKKDSKESVYVYLQKLNGYRFIAEEKHIKYQWLKGAVVYPVK